MDERRSRSVPTRLTDHDLPRWCCLPGQVARADFERLRPIADAVAEMIDPDTLLGAPAFRFGADLFNAGFFWEAHEVWEPVWMALPPNSRARTACRALIQAANACLKLRFGRLKAFARLAEEVDRLTGEALVRPEPVAGIALGAWRDDFAAFAADMAEGPAPMLGFAPADLPGFPFLRPGAS